jgi:hypothetical protein
MLERGIAEPAEVAILATAVQDHCKKHKISGEEDREHVATKVLALFRRGIVDPVHISAELERVR